VSEGASGGPGQPSVMFGGKPTTLGAYAPMKGVAKKKIH